MQSYGNSTNDNYINEYSSRNIIVHMCNVPFDSIYNVAFRKIFKERLSV